MHTIVEPLATALRTEGVEILKTYNESEIMTNRGKRTVAAAGAGLPRAL